MTCTADMNSVDRKPSATDVKVRCIVERPLTNTIELHRQPSSSSSSPSQVERDCTLLVPRSLPFHRLATFILKRLGYCRLDLSSYKASIVIRNWSGVPFESVTDEKTATTGDILNHICDVCTVNILLLRSGQRRTVDDIQYKLLSYFLQFASTILKSSKCPITTRMQLDEIVSTETEQPASTTLASSHDLVKSFDDWYSAQMTGSDGVQGRSDAAASSRDCEGHDSTSACACDLLVQACSRRTSPDDEKIVNGGSEKPEAALRPSSSSSVKRPRTPDVNHNEVHHHRRRRRRHSRSLSASSSSSSCGGDDEHTDRQRRRQHPATATGVDEMTATDLSLRRTETSDLVAAPPAAKLKTEGSDGASLQQSDAVDVKPVVVPRYRDTRDPFTPPPVSARVAENGTVSPFGSFLPSAAALQQHVQMALMTQAAIRYMQAATTVGPGGSAAAVAAGAAAGGGRRHSAEIGPSSWLPPAAGAPRRSHGSHGHSPLQGPRGSPAARACPTGGGPPSSSAGGVDPSAAAAQRRKRSRVFIDPLSEIPRLEQWFAVDSHPSAAVIEQLTDELNRSTYRQRFPRLEPKNIQLWFKNHRAKVKRQIVDGSLNCGDDDDDDDNDGGIGRTIGVPPVGVIPPSRSSSIGASSASSSESSVSPNRVLTLSSKDIKSFA